MEGEWYVQSSVKKPYRCGPVDMPTRRAARPTRDGDAAGHDAQTNLEKGKPRKRKRNLDRMRKPKQGPTEHMERVDREHRYIETQYVTVHDTDRG